MSFSHGRYGIVNMDLNFSSTYVVKITLKEEHNYVLVYRLSLSLIHKILSLLMMNVKNFIINKINALVHES